MAASISDLQAWRDALFAARLRGVRTVEAEGNRIEYRTDAEMAAAIAAADAEIARRQNQRITDIKVSCSKGY